MSRYVVRLNGTTINVPEIDDVEEYRLVNYDTEKKDYALIDPKLSMEFGQAGSLEFTMSPNHPLYYGVFDGALWNELTESARTPEYKRRLKAAKQLVKNQKNMITAKGLGFYKYDITHYRVPTKFGNIDMDDRYIVKWTKTRKKRYATQLASWDYDPSTGDIDTVYGGSARFMVGTTGLPDGVEVAYSAIFQKPNGAGFRFMGKDVLYTYINQLIANTVTAGGGVFSESKMLELDQVGLKIGEYPLKNMIAAADVGTRYDNFYNIADVYGRLMEFCGYYGTIQRLRRDVTAIEEELTSGFGNMEDQLSWTRGLVIVEEDDDIIFAGRLYSYEIDMFKRKHMVFEGALSFFHDSIQPPAEYDGVYMTDFIEALLTNHNNQVTENRKILPGYLGMANRQSIYRKTDYEDTWTCLQNYVIDTIGGYFVVRCEKMFADPEDADHYLLYLDYYNRSTVVYNGILGVSSEYTQDMYNNQVIEFQQNLLDISESFSMDDVFTQLIPLGQTEVKGEAGIDDERSLEELSLDSEWRSKYGIVLASSVNVYASASTSSQVIGTLIQNERFEHVSYEIASEGLFYKIRSADGTIEGYVNYFNGPISAPTGTEGSTTTYAAADWETCYYNSELGFVLRFRDGYVVREGPGSNFKRNKEEGFFINASVSNATYNDKGQLWFYIYVIVYESGNEIRNEAFVHESGFYLPNDEVLTRYVPGYSGRGKGKSKGKKRNDEGLFSSGTTNIGLAHGFTAYQPGDLAAIDNRLTIAEVNGGNIILTIDDAVAFEEWYMENESKLLNGDPIFTSAENSIISDPVDTGGAKKTNKKKKKTVIVKTDNLNNDLYFSPMTNGFDERFGRITKVQVFSNIKDAIELKRKGSEYLLDHVRSAIEVNVSSVDLSMVDVDFSKFKIGQFVPVKYQGWSSRFSWDMSPIWTQDGSLLRILKMEIKMDTGEKNISIGTQKKKDLTEITKDIDEEAKKKGNNTKVVTAKEYDNMGFYDPDTLYFVTGDLFTSGD